MRALKLEASMMASSLVGSSMMYPMGIEREAVEKVLDEVRRRIEVVSTTMSNGDHRVRASIWILTNDPDPDRDSPTVGSEDGEP